ncbi:CRISPR type II-A/NMEMI-associated protein Csn2 [Lachnospiraceae bacterium KHCPX20]|nr:CRISPR type II-A/NMEMI-associated protein Csn2 [Lachnospiraceae bacterium KHCPX20]
MRLLFKPISLEIPFEENRISVLAIEDPDLLVQFWMGILHSEQNPDRIILSEADKELQINKVMDVIFNPFMISLRDKKIITALYKSLLKEVPEEVQEMLQRVNQECIKVMDRFSRQSMYALDYNIELEPMNLLKLYDVHLQETGESIVDSLCDYVQAMNSLCGIRLFCFYGLRYLLSGQQLQEFYKMCFYKKIGVLIVEPRFSGKHDNEDCWIIDETQCIIEL